MTDMAKWFGRLPYVQLTLGIPVLQASFPFHLVLHPFLQTMHKVLGDPSYLFATLEFAFTAYDSHLTIYPRPSVSHTPNKLPHNNLKHLTCIHIGILILIGSGFLKFVSLSELILTLCFP